MAADRTSAITPPPPRRKLERYADEDAAWEFVRSQWLGHLCWAREDGFAQALPMMYAASGSTVWLHGSTGGGLGLRAREAELPASLTVTQLDGIVLARSAVHHSLNYSSVLAHGRLRLVTDEPTKREAFDALLDAVWSGRSTASRPADSRELAATAVLALEVDAITLKRRTGGPVDDEADLALPHWAGVVPLRTVQGTPEPAADLRSGTLGP